MLHIGNHVSSDYIKNGIPEDTPYTAMAFFLGAPQRWTPRKVSDKKWQKFKESLERCPKLKKENIVVHGCYLMNPASSREDVRIKTEKLFINELQTCELLGVGKYVFHPGCCEKGELSHTVELIKKGLVETKEVEILVENMTQTNRLCQTWEECKWVLDQVNNKRVKICLDTAHCWGAGKAKGMVMETLLDDFERIVGIDNLGAVHLNDSKVNYGSNLDRHEDILKGNIPYIFWKNFLFDERVKNIPVILETPNDCFLNVKNMIDNGNKNYVEIKNNIKIDKLPEVIEEIIKDYNADYSTLERLIPLKWKNILKNEVTQDYFKTLKDKLYKEDTIYPPIQKTFKALELCPHQNIKVCIMGQDPYINENQAEGLSFSVPKGEKIPPSLRNIYKELSTDIEGFVIPNHGNLEEWAKQGILLLNSTLTVKPGISNSHKDYGWQQFTDAILRWINDNKENIVFILMGRFAQMKCSFIDKKKHYVIETTHPSPLSAKNFFGSKPFSKCNQFLKYKKIQAITWQV